MPSSLHVLPRVAAPSLINRCRALAAAVAVAAALASCSAGSPSAAAHDAVLPLATPDHVTVATRQVAGLGAILVDGRGRSLYMFPPDARRRVTCTGPCAGTWPPLVLATGKTPTARNGVDATALSTLADPNTGARIVTYRGYPLYRYAGDVQAGTANGQALFLNGGPWYVLDTGGTPITTDPGADR